ncbi:MAG TPA: DUF6600 domain-containing protein, partial [Verrucomicrobiae bacterium]|nr:DUF6600 domain-containing protein [Verrucomicrobiae bacterium]
SGETNMKKIVASGIAAALFIGTLGAFAAPAIADDPTAGAVATAGTAGAVRISLVSGSVAVERSDTNDNVAAAVNAPVLTGDALTTSSQARAEVQFDGQSVLRVGENSQVRFANLDPNSTVVQLAQGTVGVDLLPGSTMRPEVDTPSISIRPDSVGRYRVTVTADGQTLLTVRAGSADVITPQGTQTVDVGATLVAQGPAASPSISTQDAVALDDFDRFNIDRDAELAQALAANDAYGSYDAQDLGSYGQWVYDPQYGQVWVPDNQGAGWAPYRDGQWSWEGNYYGYTWISYEPWGWAPYHYGRWAYMPHRGWGWCPPRERSPWAPGLVAFFGFGSGGGLGISIGLGNVGWVPLGPSDPYRPWWGGRRYTMIENNTTINNYGNYGHGGATSIGSARWKQGDFRHNEPVNPTTVRDAVAFNGRDVPIAPTARNMRFTQTSLPATLANRRFAQATTFARSDRGTRTQYVAPTATRAQYQPRQQTQQGQQTQRLPLTQQHQQTVNGGDAWSRFNAARGNDQQQPTRTYQQQPTRTYQQQPTRTYQQQPTRTYQQQPTRTYQQQPTRTYQQQPTRTYQQQPTRTYQQQPTRTYQQQPTRTYQQQPTRTSQQQTRGSNSNSSPNSNSGNSGHDKHQPPA